MCAGSYAHTLVQHVNDRAYMLMQQVGDCTKCSCSKLTTAYMLLRPAGDRAYMFVKQVGEQNPQLRRAAAGMDRCVLLLLPLALQPLGLPRLCFVHLLSDELKVTAVVHLQANRQAGRQTSKRAGRQANRQANKQAGRQTSKQAGKHAGRQA